jgi:hypothetical protein
VKNAWRVPFLVGGVARLAYGAGMMLAPEWMGGRFAPTLQNHPDPRMNLRGMGGTQTGVALYTLVSARSEQSARAALGLNAMVDFLDVAVSLLERRDRGEMDAMVAGGIAVNVGALLIWMTAAQSLRRS